MGKYSSSPPCKALGIIFNMNERRNHLNECEVKATDDHTQGITSKRSNRQRVCNKIEGGRGLANIEECIDTSVQNIWDNIKKIKGRLIYSSQLMPCQRKRS